MDELRRAELKVNIMKAEVNIQELYFKILKSEAEIKRTEDHIELQKKHIIKLSDELKEGV